MSVTVSVTMSVTMSVVVFSFLGFPPLVGAGVTEGLDAAQAQPVAEVGLAESVRPVPPETAGAEGSGFAALPVGVAPAESDAAEPLALSVGSAPADPEAEVEAEPTIAPIPQGTAVPSGWSAFGAGTVVLVAEAMVKRVVQIGEAAPTAVN